MSKRQKNDVADAEAICEAVGRPTMRFVPVKTVEQQSVMVLHRTRLLLMRQRTPLANAIRALPRLLPAHLRRPEASRSGPGVGGAQPED
jgi:transposase